MPQQRNSCSWVLGRAETDRLEDPIGHLRHAALHEGHDAPQDAGDRSGSSVVGSRPRSGQQLGHQLTDCQVDLHKHANKPGLSGQTCGRPALSAVSVLRAAAGAGRGGGREYLLHDEVLRLASQQLERSAGWAERPLVLAQPLGKLCTRVRVPGQHRSVHCQLCIKVLPDPLLQLSAATEHHPEVGRQLNRRPDRTGVDRHRLRQRGCQRLAEQMVHQRGQPGRWNTHARACNDTARWQRRRAQDPDEH